MTRTALLTGSTARVAEVGDALEKIGWNVMRVAGTDNAGFLTGITPASLDAYVQLPQDTPVAGETLVERVREFLTHGLLARFENASTVLPLLAGQAVVVLVAGNQPGAEATPDDRHARIDLLRVLARAILAECNDGEVAAVVVGNDQTAEQIAELVENRGDTTKRRAAELAALADDLPYADWQREMLLTTTEE